MRALDEAYTITGPTTIREVEEQIPTLDEHGNRWTLIRTRTLEAVQGPIGPAEIERNCRHTLPGYGHVYPVSDTEYEVFQGRIRLRVDPAASAREMATDLRTAGKSAPAIAAEGTDAAGAARVLQQVALGPNAPDPSEDAERIKAQFSLGKAPTVASSWRRQPFLRYAVLVALPLAAAVWVLKSPQQPGLPHSPTLTTAAIDTAGGAPTASESTRPASTPTLLLEAQPMGSPKETPPIKGKSMPKSTGTARLALAISPWGEVYVNGKRKGTSPPTRQLMLAPGIYKVEIRNVGFPPYRESIDLRSASSAKITHKFNDAAKVAARKMKPPSTSTIRPNMLLSEQWPR
jgi:hypothetical protein